MARKARAALCYATLGVGALALIYTAIVRPIAAETLELRVKRDGVSARVASLRTEVDGLAAEIDALENDPWFIERRLRSEARFLRPGEALEAPSPPQAPRPIEAPRGG
jgi:cell division protein FtsB